MIRAISIPDRREATAGAASALLSRLFPLCRSVAAARLGRPRGPRVLSARARSCSASRARPGVRACPWADVDPSAARQGGPASGPGSTGFPRSRVGWNVSILEGGSGSTPRAELASSSFPCYREGESSRVGVHHTDARIPGLRDAGLWRAAWNRSRPWLFNLTSIDEAGPGLHG